MIARAAGPRRKLRAPGRSASQAYFQNIDTPANKEFVQRYATKFGPDKPIDSNETKDGRANNRRIEFRVLTGARP